MNSKKRNARDKNLLWPAGEAPCIWMEAGIIDYKLCDRNFECEKCPFDAIMRNGHSSAPIDTTFEHCECVNMQVEKAQNSLKLQDILGMPHIHLNKDYYYGYSFWYVAPEFPHLATLGLNRMGVKLLPDIKDIIVPTPNSKVKFGKALCWFVLEQGTVCLPSPVHGRIFRANENVVEQCGDKSNPQEVWIVKVRVDDLKADLSTLLEARFAESFLQVQRAKTLDLLSHYIDTVDIGTTLQDGGAFIDNPENMLGPQRYFDFIQNIFGCRFEAPQR